MNQGKNRGCSSCAPLSRVSPPGVPAHSESGFIMLAILLLASMIFLLLGGVFHTNYLLHEWNCRQNREIQERANRLIRLAPAGKEIRPRAAVRKTPAAGR